MAGGQLRQHRLQRADRGQGFARPPRQPAGQRQPLAQAGERTGADVDREAIERLPREAVRRQQIACQPRQRHRLATLGPGGIVGELALLDDGPRTATVVCASDARVFALSAPDFRAVYDDVPAVANGLLSALAERVRELDRMVLG